MTKRIWSTHRIDLPLRKKCKTLDAVGLSIATGLNVKIKLRRPLCVLSTLTDIAETKPALVDRWKTVPGTLWQEPKANIAFKPRRGILQGYEFTATHAFLHALNPDIVKGKVKAIARIKAERAKKP